MKQEDNDIWLWDVTEIEELSQFRDQLKKKEYLKRYPSSPLYHYTDANGLKGIIESKSLWLTDIKYMNDANELTYAQNLIKNVVEDKSFEYSEHRPFFKKLEWFSDPFEDSFDVYATCFCEEEGLLSQWRSYGAYCIEFDLTSPFRTNRHFTRSSGWHRAFLRKVIYDKDQQVRIVGEIIDDLYSIFKYHLKKTDQTEEQLIQSFGSYFANVLMEFVLSFKDPIFKEEKEWRIIHLNDKKLDKVNYRNKGDYIIPYVDISFRTVDETDFEEYFKKIEKSGKPVLSTDYDKYINCKGKFPLTKVTIGPINHPEIAKKSVHDLLFKNKFLRCRVTSSSSSLRDDW